MRRNGVATSYLAGDSTSSTWRFYLISSYISMRGGGMLTHNTTTTGTSLCNGQWNHLAFVYDAVAHVSTWYVNGVVDSTVTNQNPNISGTNFQIGNYTATSNSYSGELDDFRFWDVARSAAEIQAGMNMELNNGPTITATAPSVNLGAAAAGTAGTEVSFDSNGFLLTGPTTITAPSGVEVSFAQSSGYASSIQISTFPTYGPTTIWARIADTAAIGPVTGLITLSSTGANNVDITVSGDVVSLVPSTNNLNLGFTVIGTPGNAVSYDLSGDGLTVGTAIAAPPGFELALSAAGPFSPTLNVPTTPTFAETVYVRLDGVNTGNFSGDVTNVSGPASVNVAVVGDVYPPDNLHAARNGPNVSTQVDNNVNVGSDGLVLLDFSMNTILQAWTLTDLTFTASGTADEQDGVNFLALYEDSTTAGTGGVFDGPFVDTLATASPGVSFNGPNGAYNAVLANSACPANTVRRFFLVCKLAGKARAGETLHAELTSVNASSTGTGIITGAPTAHPLDAFTINAPQLAVVLNGPVVFQVVNNDEQGPGGNGLVIADFRIRPKNEGWTINSLTFKQDGTIDGQAGISFLNLYVDDGDGIWEDPATDLPATAAAGVNFNAPQGIYTAGLTAAAGAHGVNEVKRFFLVAKLSGTGQSGETLQVSIANIVENAPVAGTLVGVPSGSTSAIMIDQPTLTVNAGPANPTVLTREKSAAGFAEMIGNLRLSASNADFTVAGITLHTSGSGDWLNDLDAAAGLQVFRDNGNGSFDAGDILLCSAPGATPSVACVFTTNQNVPMSTDLDLWIVLNVLSSAGGSPFDTFMTAVESAADVNSLTAGGIVKLGMLTPASGELRVVDFQVTDFSPTVDLFAGGGLVKIEGSGFALPVTVTIGGIPCAGTAIVDAAGTQISGLEVPAGTGSNLAIVLTTNNLPPRTLTQTFRYSSVLPNLNTGGTAAPSSDGCVASAAAPLSFLGLPALAAAAFRRRRK